MSEDKSLHMFPIVHIVSNTLNSYPESVSSSASAVLQLSLKLSSFSQAEISFFSKRRCKINVFLQYVQEWPGMFYDFSLKIGATQSVFSIKACIPPGVPYKRHVCVCMYVDIQVSYIYISRVLYFFLCSSSIEQSSLAKDSENQFAQ